MALCTSLPCLQNNQALYETAELKSTLTSISELYNKYVSDFVWHLPEGRMSVAAGSHFFRQDLHYTVPYSWLRGTVVERRPLAGELPLSCTRPAADG